MKFPKLCFPEYDFKIQSADSSEQSLKIFDIIRKKYVSLTPEEWVRQHLLHFMVKERKFPQTLLSVEKKVLVNRLFRRTDVVVYSSELKPILIAECKAPDINLDEQTLAQALRYNLVYNVSFLIITNGMQHFFFVGEANNKSWRQSEKFPDYEFFLAGI